MRIVLCKILILLPLFLMAQTSDITLVEQTVSYYLDGGTNNDFETLKKAFHPDATMKFIKGDEYTQVNAIEFFEGVIKPGPIQERKTKIEYINISGRAASVKLRIDYDTFYFIDYMNLLKVAGEWKVVNKIYIRQNK